MKLLFTLLLITLFTQGLCAQSQVFDIVTFTPPKGWTKEVKENQVTFSKVDKSKKSWCVIGLIKSTVSKGSIEEDFKSEWDLLAVKAYQATDLTENDILEADGWKVKAGGGKFIFNNADAMVLLTTMSGYQVCTSILATTNSQSYLSDIDNFLKSVTLQKPVIQQPATQQPESQPITTNNTTNGNSNYTYSTTNFDNGWRNEIKEDWVEVTKGDIKVYLWYILPYNASDFSGTGKQARHFYWDNYVTRYFNIETVKFDNHGVLSDISQELVEGWATEKSTGLKRYIAMRIYISTNAASIILVSATDEQALLKQFPSYTKVYDEDVSPMKYYNRFAVGKSDVVGTWSDGGSSAAYMYYTSGTGTGVYGSMTVASTDSKLNFYKGGNYDCVEKSTMGHMGALTSNKAEYKGKYTVSDWVVTLTNRFKGRTETFNAWFEVVRGGRILHLQNQKYTSTHYYYVKSK